MVRFHLWRDGVQSKYVEAGGYRMHYFEAGLRMGLRELRCCWCMGWARAARTGRR